MSVTVKAHDAAMIPATVVPNSVSAESINLEHSLARGCAEGAIKHAIRCGELLQSKKATLPHGTFMGWVDAHCEFQYSTAARYMKAAAQSSTGVEISRLSEIFASGRKRETLSKRFTQASDDDPYFRQEWVDLIPMESGMVTFGCISDTPAMALVESILSPGFWHDINVLDGTSSVRPCSPSGLRWRLMTDVRLAAATWGTAPDSGDWLEREADYGRQRI